MFNASFHWFSFAIRAPRSSGRRKGCRPRQSKTRPTTPPFSVTTRSRPLPSPTSKDFSGRSVAFAVSPRSSGTRRIDPYATASSSRFPPGSSRVTRKARAPSLPGPTGATALPSRIRQSFSKTSFAARGCTVESTPSCGIMKIESTESSVTCSGRNASSIMRAACARRGACDRTPPLPTRRSRWSSRTSVSPLAVCSKVSEMVLSCCTPLSPTASDLCCSNARRRASRAIACSMINSSSDCGMVVGRIILFLIRFRRSRSSMSNGTQRMMFARPASARTLLTL